jgi:hypothetical protein
MIHQAQRPPLSEVPADCPKKVAELLELCWSANRATRRSAMDCYTLLKYHHEIMSKRNEYDIYMSHDGGRSNLLCYVAYKLSQMGLRVYYNQTGPSTESSASILNNNSNSSNFNIRNNEESASMEKSKVILVMASQSYQANDINLQVLRDSKRVKPEPLIVPVFLDPNPALWRNQELVYLCQLHSTALKTYDISSLAAAEYWADEHEFTVI